MEKTKQFDIPKQRCWKYDWVLEFDIKGLFDNISHELLMKAVRKHTAEKWIVLYIERWLVAPMQAVDGTIVHRMQGTPQGGVVSPVLSNLFLHYVFDLWMKRNHSEIPWCRYADDGLLHCKTLQEAEELLQQLQHRFNECGLELHPDKTKIIYCKDGKRKKKYPKIAFDFLGYTFRARRCKSSVTNELFESFTPAVSNVALKSMRLTTKRSGVRNRTELELQDIANWFNPILQGWINYYGRYARSAMYPMARHFNLTLVSWAMKKYRRFHNRKTKAAIFIERIARKQSQLFAHWKAGMFGSFA